MPETLPDHVPNPRTLLVWDGTRYRAVRGHTDGTLQVRGEDQHFSIKGVLAQRKTGAISGADGYYDSNPVLDGEYWVVTTIVAMDWTSPTTVHDYDNVHDGNEVLIHSQIQAFGAKAKSYWSGMTVLDKDDVIRAYFTGALAGDTIYLDITGYRMTVET